MLYATMVSCCGRLDVLSLSWADFLSTFFYHMSSPYPLSAALHTVSLAQHCALRCLASSPTFLVIPTGALPFLSLLFTALAFPSPKRPLFRIFLSNTMPRSSVHLQYSSAPVAVLTICSDELIMYLNRSYRQVALSHYTPPHIA